MQPMLLQEEVVEGQGVAKAVGVKGVEYFKMFVNKLVLKLFEAMQEDDILQQLNHEYMKELMLREEEKREAKHKAQQEMNDKEALRMSLEEETIYEREDGERLRKQIKEEE
uniref:Uncharacterized protein n=1 Tax=Tanacetum cinerariifolium TaxID=118510 RepID=A0A6L2NAP5_TANCI|nr:hypothetical protein [Tanacetum cinerariifolium]